MEFAEKHLEMRGMKRIELVNYFISIGSSSMSGEILIGQGWEVRIAQEKIITLGSLKIPATIVILNCREDLIEQMMLAFQLRFLSAGG